jgi:hypothetical protein
MPRKPTHEAEDLPMLEPRDDESLVSHLGPAQPQAEEIAAGDPARTEPPGLRTARRRRKAHGLPSRAPGNEKPVEAGGDLSEEERPELPQSSQDAYGISGER